MQGKFIIWLLATFLLAGTSFAQAQQLKVYHVGVLVVGSADIPQIMGLRDGLRELGYIQGKNLALDIPRDRAGSSPSDCVLQRQRRKSRPRNEPRCAAQDRS